MMMKTIIATFLICFAAALPLNEENPWTKLFDDQENDELDFIENDKKGKMNKKTCCQITGYVYEKNLVRGKSKCIRSLRVVVSPSSLKISYGEYLNSTTVDLGNELFLRNGILYESTNPGPRCHKV